MRTRALVCGAVAVCLCGSTTAEARSVVVVPLAATEGSTAADAARIGEAVAAAVRERGHEVDAPAQAQLAIDGHTPGCVASRRPSCWATAALALGRELVVSGRVARDERTGDLSVTLEAIDAETARSVAEATHRAVGSTPQELDALARAVATTLLDALPAPRRRARLSVTSEPAGATVTVNSHPMGRTPWSGGVPEGPTTVLVELDAYVPQSRTFSLAADEVQEVHVALAPDAGSAGAHRRVAHRFDALDAVLLGVAGVGALGGGAIAIASVAPGEECVGRPDATGQCPRVRQAGNLWPVGAVIGIGVTAGVIAVLRFIVGDRAPIRPTVEPQARTIGVEGQF